MFKRKISFLMILFLMVSCAGKFLETNESAANQDEIKYANAQKVQKYRVKLPDNYIKGQPYPVLIMLHGNGGDGLNFSSAFSDYKKQPIIMVFPEGQYAKPIQGTVGYSWYYETNDKKMWEKYDRLTVDNLIPIINAVKNEYNSGTVCVFGFSQGASLALMAGLLYPDYFKGAVAVGGSMPDIDVSGSIITSLDVKKAANLKVYIARGKSDFSVKKELFDIQKNFFEDNDFDYEAYEYDGGHQITYELMDKILNWMKTKL